MPDLIAYWLIGIGLAFDLFGCIGLVRLPDVYNRAQAATKCVTLGTCMVLMGVGVHGAVAGHWAMFVKAAICTTFILMTSPVGAHAVCRAAHVAGVPLADCSVEDAFVDRSNEIRAERARAAYRREVQCEEAETPRT